MDFVSDSARNPFGLHPPCESSVPGYGDTTADFHVIGDHPGVHGGETSGIPFSDRPWSAAFFDALERGGLVSATDEGLVTHRTFFSYLHMCESEDETPSERAYADAEAYFDAELRAITAHVLFPVGERATRHVFAQYTAREPGQVDMAALHTEEIRGAGWLVVPVADPVGWSDDEADRLAERATRLLDRDYRQQSDLGRFLAGNDPYFVR